MKKNLIRLVCLLMVAVSFLFVSCKADKKTVEGTDPNHQAEISTTDIPFIENGRSDYKIVIPKNADQWEKMGADELTTFIEQATDIELKTITDDEASWSSDAKYLSVGQTSLATAAGISVDAGKLGESGFQIETKDKSVFMVGGSSYGSLFATYDFLKYHFNFEVFSSDAIRLDKNVKSLNLLNMKVLEIPDIPWRVSAYGWVTYDSYMNKRFRMFDSNEIIMPVNGGYTIHNIFQYLPTDVYMTDHPSWFSTDGKQVCYTARGNQQELEAMKKVVVDKMLETIEKYPQMSTITFTQADVASWCSCETCTKMRSDYGNSDSASLIKFINQVADDVNAELKKAPEPRDVTILIFAYQRSENPPVKVLKDGSYAPIDDSVVLRDNVSVYYAPITANYSYSFLDGQNAANREILKKWKVLSKKVYMWTYSTNFNGYLMPFNSFNIMQENYRFLKEMDTYYLFDQAQWNQTNGTAFHNLKAYLNSKLQWNVNEDYNKLIDEYFETYFMQASKSMRQYFEDLRTWLAYLEQNRNLSGDIYLNLENVKFWPRQTLDKFMSYIDAAYEEIAYLEKLDSVTYQKLCDRITLESLFPRYALITLYGNYMTDSEEMEMKRQFKTDAMKLNVTRFAEGGEMSQLYKKWGV